MAKSFSLKIVRQMRPMTITGVAASLVLFSIVHLLERHGFIQGFSWNPRVRHAERGA